MQDDEETVLCNICTDLVSLRKNEPFLRQLLGSKPPGEWVPLREFCTQAGLGVGEIKPDLFATWLPDPLADDAYAVVMFYDDESKWSMAAHYNRGRLLRDASLEQPSGNVVAPSCSTT
jgi:hypothetical protein